MIISWLLRCRCRCIFWLPVFFCKWCGPSFPWTIRQLPWYNMESMKNVKLLECNMITFSSFFLLCMSFLTINSSLFLSSVKWLCCTVIFGFRQSFFLKKCQKYWLCCFVIDKRCVFRSPIVLRFFCQVMRMNFPNTWPCHDSSFRMTSKKNY